MSRPLIALGLVFALAATPAGGAGPVADGVKIDEKTQKSIDRALVYLKAQQGKDGSWGGGNTAVTAFALLAFMSNGHVPNQGLYGPDVAKGVRFLLAVASSRDDGYLAGSRGGNMYSHGMATLALSQAFGMSGDDEVKKALKRAVELIVKTQNAEGGWRYNPAPIDADISATIMQVMALRGAKDSGLNVPNETLKRAVSYINRCQETSSGGYRYQPFSSGPGFARTAAGVCVLQLTGDYEARPIERALEYMERHPNDGQHYWYGHYYAAHAYHQVGGKKWENYYAKMRGILLETQAKSGEWERPDEGGAGQARVAYQTAIAVLILSVPANYLPIYQR